MSEDVRKVVILGSGPAGLTAAIYASRAALKPLLYEGFSVGGLPGGQLVTTTEVENYPGFPEGIDGPALMQRMRAQAARFDTHIVTEDAKAADLAARPFLVEGDKTSTRAHALIIATGAVAKRLNLPGEDRFWNKGVSACATCDGGLPIFRGKKLAVVGGGDSACEEALFLTRFAGRVIMLVRRDVLRASKIMQTRVAKHEKIDVMWLTSPLEFLGDETLGGVRVRNNRSGDESVLEVAGLFYAVGHKPNTDFLDGQLGLDELSYIKTAPDSTQTSVEGVYAAGDVQDHVFRQAVTAAASGCMAAIEAERWLSKQEL